MLRSLGVVLVIVVALWFFGQASPSDVRTVRTVDQAGDVATWRSAVPSAPVPSAPQGWLPTVSQYVPSPTGLRLGWNTPDRRYVEFATSTGPSAAFVQATAGSGTAAGSLDVGGVPWQRYVDGDGSLSLVRALPGGVTVVVGTSRTNAPDSEVIALAATVRP